MSEINDHVILGHIDTPARILFWPANQVAACAIPLGLGMATDNILAGLIVSCIVVNGFKYFNKRFGKGRLRSMMYWRLPTSDKLIRSGLPPSHTRYWFR